MGFFKWLKNLFSSKPQRTIDEEDEPHPETGYPEDNKPAPPANIVYKKIAIIVGHTKDAQGAATYKVGGAHIPEYTWNTARAKEIAQHINQQYPSKDVKIFYRDGVGISGVAKLVGQWKPDVSLELHFNSIGHDKDAFGSEMLIVDGDDLSADISANLIGEVSRKFNTKLRNRYTTKAGKDYRGIKALKKGDRGYYNIKYVKNQGVKVAMLIEPFFAGTKTEESKQFIEDPQKYSKVVGDFLGKMP